MQGSVRVNHARHIMVVRVGKTPFRQAKCQQQRLDCLSMCGARLEVHDQPDGGRQVLLGRPPVDQPPYVAHERRSLDILVGCQAEALQFRRTLLQVHCYNDADAIMRLSFPCATVVCGQ